MSARSIPGMWAVVMTIAGCSASAEEAGCRVPDSEHVRGITLNLPTGFLADPVGLGTPACPFRHPLDDGRSAERAAWAGNASVYFAVERADGGCGSFTPVVGLMVN